MKKFMAIMLALVLALGMTSTAFAATITITEPSNGDQNETAETYTAYKILTADSTGTVYTIAANDTMWLPVLQKEEQTWLTLTLSADSTVYVVTLKKGVDNDEDTAKAIADYLNTQKPSGAVGFEVVSGATVDAGYYLITSSLGTVLVLDTANDVTINEKNTYPTLEKEANKNSATIGTDVEFTLTLTVPATADTSKTVTVHDEYEDGFTPDTNSIVAYVLDENGARIVETEATEETPAVYKTVSYTLGTVLCDECDFEVVFDVADVAGKTIEIVYTAELDKDAEMATETNTNTAWLTYSAFESTHAPVDVATYTTTFTKVSGVNQSALAGAQFKLYADAEKETELKVVLVTEGDVTNATVYRVADTTEATYATITTPVSGKIVIKGLESASYYLEETVAPTGYNLMTSLFELKIENANTADDTYKVENNIGSELPSTGGMGTTIFYVVGGMMMAAAFVLLITKRKVASEK